MIDPHFQTWINKELSLFFDQKKKESEQIDSRLGDLISQIADVTLRGGDRLRPYMCFVGYQIGGGKTQEKIISVLLALELFHTFALIHDDIMDEADRRRGGPTINAHFTKNLRTAHLGESLAILAGDLSYIWSQELFYEINHLSKSKSIFQKLQEEVAYGQIRDVWGMKDQAPESILDMYTQKSGNYSVKWPLLLGFALSQKQDSSLGAALETYGHAVGLAFQLKDDLLGLFGDEKQTGKAVGDDIREGKWTYIISLLQNKLTGSNKERFVKVFGNSHLTEGDIYWLQNLCAEVGVKNEVENEMKKLVGIAQKALDGTEFPQKAELSQLASFIIERNV